jgi:hypothetical protein
VIILPDDPNVVSFNDDTSPDRWFSRRPKIVVNGQVNRETGLDWFFRLLVLCPNAGEVKADSVWIQFCNLRSGEKDLVWAGLSKVHIHIVDPEPYIQHSKDVLRESWRRNDAPELLDQLCAKGVHGADRLQRELTKYAVSSILRDSTAVRLNSLANALANPFVSDASDDLSQCFTFSYESPDPIDIDDFGPDTRPLIRNVTGWAAKSAAAFDSALQCVEEMDEEIESYRFFPERLILRRMESRILKTHAFDEGNQRHIDLLEAARSSILKTLDSPYLRYTLVPPRYRQIKSHKSSFIQAADVAAGFATRLMDTAGLVGVVSRFEYVTHNGVRLSRAAAEERMRPRG